MNIISVDDNSMHLSLVQTQLKAMFKKYGIEVNVLGTANNGLDGFNLYSSLVKSGKKIDICTFDIRMPKMDGLSAMFKIKKMNPSQMVIMASSEDDKTVSKNPGPASKLPMNEKMALLKKVEERVLSGKVEPNKISFILHACEELLLDPIEIAKQYGANGYMHKPYKVEDTEKLVKHLIEKKSGFLRVA